MSAGLTASEVVSLLDRLFGAFDALADRYRVEKIKTIGDAYMVAAGVLPLAPITLRRSRNMALDMRDLVEAGPDADRPRMAKRQLGPYGDVGSAVISGARYAGK